VLRLTAPTPLELLSRDESLLKDLRKAIALRSARVSIPRPASGDIAKRPKVLFVTEEKGH
jgi:hypothetical protein